MIRNLYHFFWVSNFVLALGELSLGGEAFPHLVLGILALIALKIDDLKQRFEESKK